MPSTASRLPPMNQLPARRTPMLARGLFRQVAGWAWRLLGKATIQNWTTSSCSSGIWSTVQHAMRIVATPPFTFRQWTVRTSTSNHGTAASYGSAIGFGCVNTNLTNWSVNIKGYMNKGGVNYETPYLTDSFGLSQNCGR